MGLEAKGTVGLAHGQAGSGEQAGRGRFEVLATRRALGPLPLGLLWLLRQRRPPMSLTHASLEISFDISQVQASRGSK